MNSDQLDNSSQPLGSATPLDSSQPLDNQSFTPEPVAPMEPLPSVSGGSIETSPASDLSIDQTSVNPAPPSVPENESPVSTGWSQLGGSNPAPAPAPISEQVPINIETPTITPDAPTQSAPVQPTAEGQAEFSPQEMPNPMASGGKNIFLIIILVVLLASGGLYFAYWKGWIFAPKETLVPIINNQTEQTAQTRDLQRKNDLVNIKSALKQYYQINQSYPLSQKVQNLSESDNIIATQLKDFISPLPKDPSSPTYYYGYISDGKTFTLTAVLEDKNDPNGKEVGNYLIYEITDISVELPIAPTDTLSDEDVLVPKTEDEMDVEETDSSSDSASDSSI